MKIENYDLVTATYIAYELGYDHLLQQVGKVEYDLDWDELAKGKTVWDTKIGSITIELQESNGVKVLCYIDDEDNGETCFSFENDVEALVSCTLDAIKTLRDQVV